MKTRSYKIALFLLFVFFSHPLISQNITENEKQEIISNLAITDSMTSRHAIYEVMDYKMQEAIHAIIENLWKQTPFVQILFLTALNVLNYENVSQLTLAFIDSADHFNNSEEPNIRLEMKSFANTILFYHGNFSQRQNTYNYSHAIFPETNDNIILALVSILEKYSKNEIEAKNELINIAQNSTNRDARWVALGFLYQIFGEEILPIAEQRLLDEKDSGIKVSIIYRIVGNFKNETIHRLFMDQALVDTSDDVKDSYIDCLLTDYATPNDYRIVKEARPQLTDDIYIDYVKNSILNFRAFPTDSNATTKVLIDSLVSYHNQCNSFNWLGDSNISSQLQSTLSEAQQKLVSGDSLGAAVKIKQYQSLINQAYKDSTAERYVTRDGYKFLYYYPQYILERLPKIPTVKLENSSGSLLPGGTLQYYEGGWKDAIDNGDGTFSVDTKQKNVSLRMNYAYGSQTKSNVTVGTDTVVFQTVNAKVQLQNSIGSAIDTGRVQYYVGAWREFGTTSDGTASKELLPGNYSFRMSYAYASTDKAQDISVNPNVVFQTVNANVQLQNSSGNLIDQGTVQYYSGAWRDFGATTNGIASKELLPNNYSFRMTYAYASTDKQQDLKTNPTVVFQTVNAQVQLKNSLGNLIDAGTVQYYSGAWREFGATTNGIASKELLPNNYSFRMTYAFASTDKQQDLKTNPVVVFQTVNTQVQLKNSLGNLIDAGTVQYYSGAWRDFGATENGIASKELLPNNYSFRMAYAFASTDKQQDLKTDPTVVFQTVNAQVQLKNSLGILIDAGTVQYYSGAWREFGATTNGIASKELLPNNYSFRITYAYASTDKQQDLKTNPTVVFQTVNAQVQLKNSLGNLIDAGTVQYYSGAWRDFGATTNGIASRELLPNNYSFRMTYAYASTDKQQDLKTNPTVVFQTVNAQVQLKNSLGNLMDQGTVQYYSGAWREFGTTVNGTATKELLPNNYSFRMTHEYISKDISQNVGANNIVNFSTVLCTIRAKDAQGNPLNNALVSYYSGAWRQIGLTVNGEITKELLPANITFRVNYNSTQKDKAQDITTNNIVEFGF